jgi:hypothetical protein
MNMYSTMVFSNKEPAIKNKESQVDTMLLYEIQHIDKEYCSLRFSMDLSESLPGEYY